VNWTGLPIALTPLTTAEVAGLANNQPVILDVNADLERGLHCKSLASRVAAAGYWARISRS